MASERLHVSQQECLTKSFMRKSRLCLFHFTLVVNTNPKEISNHVVCSFLLIPPKVNGGVKVVGLDLVVFLLEHRQQLLDVVHAL